MGADPVTAAIGGGLSIGANILAGDQKRSAAKAGMKARERGLLNASEVMQSQFDEASNILEKRFGTAQRYFDPYSKSGRRALNMYEDGLQKGFDVESTPGFKVQADLLNKQLGQQLASAGKSRSGVGISQYSIPAYSNLMQNEYQNYFNRLTPLMNMGLTADSNRANIQQALGTGQANIEQALGSNLANLETALGDSKYEYELQRGDINAAVTTGIANAGSDALEQIAKYKSYKQGNR